jgi:hypothetical protein
LVALAAVAAAAVAKKLRCWLGWHRWVRHVNDEAEAYFLCADCDKFRDSSNRDLDVTPPPPSAGV